MDTRRLHLSFALAFGLLALAGALALLRAWGSGSPVAQAGPPAPLATIPSPGNGTRYVSSVSGNDSGNDCTGDAAPCQTIQHAVDQATDGDEIWIATQDNTTPAIYTGSSGDSVIALHKSLTLRGGYIYLHSTMPPVNDWAHGLTPSSVDGEGTRRALYVSGDVTPTLRMLAFVNGYADRGGNVYAEDAHVRFIATPIMSGTATYGGGLYLKNCRASFDPGDLSLDPGGLDWTGQPGISGLLLIQNNAAQYGGGIYIERGIPILAGLAVYSNAATADGGGFYLQGGHPVVAGGLVLENRAGDRGGGFFLADSAARVAGTAVYSNTAADGAGFYLDGPFAFSEETVPIIANNYVRHNRTTSSQGGGFYFRQAIAGLVNNVIADNQATDGAGLYLWASSPQLFHNTIAQNAGNSGVYLTHKPGSIWPPVVPIPSRPTLTNTIIASHTLGVYIGSTGLPDPLQNRATLEGTLWWGNGNDTGGSGPVVHSTDVYSDPLFTCTGGPPDCVLPYHILTNSAAVDAGVVVALAIPGSDLFVDIDGQLRPSNGHYEIGADEVVTRAFDAWFMPPVSTLGTEPGQIVTHTHWLMNTGIETDTYDLNLYSSGGWAAFLTTSPITLSAQTSTTVQVRVTVPDTATSGLQETSRITATSRSDPDCQAYVLDRTEVVTGEQTDLAVGKWADTDTVQQGEAVHYTIVVTNAGPLTETLAVTLTDTAVPTRAIGAWSLSAGCTGNFATGMVICTRTLPGGSVPVSESLVMVITTTDTYTGLLVDTAVVGAAARDSDTANNVAQTTVGVTPGWKVYLPLVLRNS